MHFLSEYGLYLAKLITLVATILIIIGGIAAIVAKAKDKDKDKGKLIVTKLNEKYNELANTIQQHTLTKTALQQEKKEQKAREKKAKAETKNRIFVIDFEGDIKASAVTTLREEITALLLTTKPDDEVLVRLNSAGGIINAYGLAASQLQRLKEAKIKLIIAVDKIAASGGYMMACIADHIIAAPFSIVGSIGVVSQLPNFHRFLKKKYIDFEQITAGEYKRTLSLFGENTNKGRAKMQEEVEDAHELFKSFIQEHRPQVDLTKISTGEHWFAARAVDLKLIDKLQTSDDYLLAAKDRLDIYEIQYKIKKPLSKRLSIGFANLLGYFTS